MVGYAPDLRHPLAPREVVYQCEEPKRRMKTPLFWRIVTLPMLAYCALIVIRGALYIAHYWR